jgi:hypothetical protein
VAGQLNGTGHQSNGVVSKVVDQACKGLRTNDEVTIHKDQKFMRRDVDSSVATTGKSSIETWSQNLNAWVRTDLVDPGATIVNENKFHGHALGRKNGVNTLLKKWFFEVRQQNDRDVGGGS